MPQALTRRLFYLGKSLKQGIAAATDAFLLFGSGWLVSVSLTGAFPPSAFVGSLVLAFTSSICLRYFGVYRTVYKYWSLTDVHRIVKAFGLALPLVLGAAAVAPTSALAPFDSVSLAAALLFGCFLVLATRILVRRLFMRMFRDEYETGVGRAKNTVIYGAGEAGYQLATALKFSQTYRVVAFVDDSKDRWGKSILNIPIHPPSDLSELHGRAGLESALIAIPSAGRKRIAEVARSLEPLGLVVRALPGVEDLVCGRVSTNDLKEVPIEDLLGREPVPPDIELMKRRISDKAVLVTGAGGSIGSELCRQILALKPSTLVLLDHSEFALYAIDKEFRARVSGGGTHLVSVLGSVVDTARIEQTVRAYGIDTLYHAAAYKHVPIVEANPVDGVINNVMGTWNTLEAAIRGGVQAFVLISTDKAVRPTNVMGASKRLAEMTLQAVVDRGLAHRDSLPDICMVRFGNVLGSSGSVVPLFREQIRRGGPITLTHEDITRYFMTIPEAAQLVLQAGAMGRTGDVFLLDMGDPVRIIDLAKRMIRLSGFEVRDHKNPGGDIAIDVVGLRPGEKLYEELLIDASAQPTLHPRIARAEERYLPWRELSRQLDILTKAVKNRDSASVLSVLERTVDGYQVSPNALAKASEATPKPRAARSPRRRTIRAKMPSGRTPFAG